MGPLSRRLSRLGLVLTAAALAMTAAIGPVNADPTESAEPSESTESAPISAPAEPPSSEPVPTAPVERKAEKPDEKPAEKNTRAGTVRDLEVTAKFDKASYITGEKMTIAVTVHNPTTTALSVSASMLSLEADAIKVDYEGDFARGEPFLVSPGKSVTHTVTGAVADAAITTATLYVLLTDDTGFGERFTASTPVTPKFGHAAGTVFLDANDNGQFDTGEGVSNATLRFTSVVDYNRTLSTTSNTTGAFRLDQLPTGQYSVFGSAPGLLVTSTRVTITESGVDGLRILARQPVTGLAVKLEFIKDVYGPDERPTVRVTLTNSGDRQLRDIVANCNRSGEGPQLNGVGSGWGELDRVDGDGVTVAAHATKVLEVGEPMPASASDWGYAVVSCDFGYKNTENGLDDPRASDRAKVPGKRADLNGRVADNGTGVPGVRVVLTTDAHCPILGETTTDADGKFTLKQMPVGEHKLFLLPPAGWHIEGANPATVWLIASRTSDEWIEAAPGDAALPRLPVRPADCVATPTTTTPAPQGSPTPGLASTGASIFLPGMIGLAALLAGGGALVVSRRRKTK